MFMRDNYNERDKGDDSKIEDAPDHDAESLNDGFKLVPGKMYNVTEVITV